MGGARMILRDPERCPKCQGRSYVVESRATATYRWRRRRCLSPTCVDTLDHRTVWRTYESLINPSFVRLRQP